MKADTLECILLTVLLCAMTGVALFVLHSAVGSWLQYFGLKGGYLVVGIYGGYYLARIWQRKN